jgi:hypothetical protein
MPATSQRLRQSGFGSRTDAKTISQSSTCSFQVPSLIRLENLASLGVSNARRGPDHDRRLPVGLGFWCDVQSRDDQEHAHRVESP